MGFNDSATHIVQARLIQVGATVDVAEPLKRSQDGTKKLGILQDGLRAHFRGMFVFFLTLPDGLILDNSRSMGTRSKLARSLTTRIDPRKTTLCFAQRIIVGKFKRCDQGQQLYYPVMSADFYTRSACAYTLDKTHSFHSKGCSVLPLSMHLRAIDNST